MFWQSTALPITALVADKPDCKIKPLPRIVRGGGSGSSIQRPPPTPIFHFPPTCSAGESNYCNQSTPTATRSIPLRRATHLYRSKYPDRDSHSHSLSILEQQPRTLLYNSVCRTLPSTIRIKPLTGTRKSAYWRYRLFYQTFLCHWSALLTRPSWVTLMT